MLFNFSLCSNKSQNMGYVMHFVCFLNDCHNYITKQASDAVWIPLFIQTSPGPSGTTRGRFVWSWARQDAVFALLPSHLPWWCRHLGLTPVQRWQVCAGGLKMLRKLMWAQFSKREQKNTELRVSSLHPKEQRSPGMARAGQVPAAASGRIVLAKRGFVYQQFIIWDGWPHCATSLPKLFHHIEIPGWAPCLASARRVFSSHFSLWVKKCCCSSRLLAFYLYLCFCIVRPWLLNYPLLHSWGIFICLVRLWDVDSMIIMELWTNNPE